MVLRMRGVVSGRSGGRSGKKVINIWHVGWMSRNLNCVLCSNRQGIGVPFLRNHFLQENGCHWGSADFGYRPEIIKTMLNFSKIFKPLYILSGNIWRLVWKCDETLLNYKNLPIIIDGDILMDMQSTCKPETRNAMRWRLYQQQEQFHKFWHSEGAVIEI